MIRVTVLMLVLALVFSPGSGFWDDDSDSEEGPFYPTLAGGCFFDGNFYHYEQFFDEGYDAILDWCYGKFCDYDGFVYHWDKWNCRGTITTPAPTTPPTPPLGCTVDGKFYPPSSDISRGEDRGTNRCFGVYCDRHGKIIPWEDTNCFPTTGTTVPTSTGTTTQEITTDATTTQEPTTDAPTTDASTTDGATTDGATTVPTTGPFTFPPRSVRLAGLLKRLKTLDKKKVERRLLMSKIF